MKKQLKIIMAIVLAVSMLAGISACSNGNNDTPSSSQSSTDGVGTTSSNAQREKGSIVMSIDWPTFIDPAVGSKGSDSVAALNMYDTLAFPNSDGTVSPNAAKSWDVSADSTIYTFHLRDDIKFHSGNKLTASDVKFSMDRLLTIGEGFAYLFTDVIKEVKVIDDQTVEFTLKAPSGTFPAMLIRLYILDEKTVRAHINPSGSYGKNGDYGKEWLMVNDAGSGPYKVREMKTEEYLIMERYADYWSGWEAGAPESIKLLGGLEATAVRTMISRGELDITNDAQTPEAYNAMDSMNGVDVVRLLSGVNVNLMLNTKKAPTDDIHVRRAMAYAIDYDTIINNIYTGSEKATGPVVAGMSAAALTEEDMPYRYNLEKAKEELKQSKYYDQLTNGQMPISFTWCSEGGLQQEKLALLFQAGMAEVGVKVEITGKPFATMMTDAQTAETTPNASIVAFAPAYLDAGSILKTRYHSSSCGSWEQMEWLKDNEIDSLISNALVIVDQKERNDKYKEIGKKLVELSPTVWLFDAATTYAYRSDYIKVWPTVEKNVSGESFLYAMGYPYYFRDFRLAD
jgi:peptide/nickel transport system substrate-binding protein